METQQVVSPTDILTCLQALPTYELCQVLSVLDTWDRVRAYRQVHLF